MSSKTEPSKFLISIEELLVKYEGKYAEPIDKNLYYVVCAIMRDRADLLIPREFRDTTLDLGELGSHLQVWVNENLVVSETVDLVEEILPLIDDCDYLLNGYSVLKGKVIRVKPTGHYQHIYIDVVGRVNDLLVEHYKELLVGKVASEEWNPLQLET